MGKNLESHKKWDFQIILIPGTWMNFEVGRLGSKKASYGGCHDEGWKKDPLHVEKKKLERMNDDSL